MRVVVVGAGVVGASVARALADRGDDVHVVDMGAPGSGTTATTFAWVNANSKEPLDYFELNVAGMRAHHQMGDDTPPTPWWFPTGNLMWCQDGIESERLDARVEILRERGYTATWLSSQQVKSLEPDVTVPHGASVAYFANEGHCLPALLLAHLLGQARDRGVRIHMATQVLGFETTRSGVRVVLDDPQVGELTVDAVVCCVGRWTSDLLSSRVVPMLGPQRDEAVTLGYLGTTSPIPARLSRVLTTPGLNVRPAGGGRLVLQSLDLDPTDGAVPMPSRTGSLAHTMLDRLADLFPVTGESLRFEELCLGRRAMPADGRTVSGYLPGSDRIYVVVTHSGITLGPLLGSLVAAELHGTPSRMLSPFRPDRFQDMDDRSDTPTQPRAGGEQ